jgi:hypothetical protein
MRPIQNAGGHVGLTARSYPIAHDTAIAKGQVVKLSGALVVTAAANETGAILGVAAENHPGAADVLDPRANGTEILVWDNPELISECPVSVIAAASGSATTVVPASGDVASAVADDGYNGGVLVLVAKAANSANTDPVGKRITITDYTKSGTVISKASGGTPSAGDKYELYPAVGSTICGLDSGRQSLVVSATGASALRVIGHDYDRHMIRCMAVKHALGGTN